MSLFLLVLGIVILVAVIVFICVAAWNKRIGVQLAFTLGVMGVIACIVVANLPNIVGLVLKSGDKTAYGLELQRVEQKAKEVATDTDEVRRMKEQIEALVKRVEQGEQNVTAMRDNVRQAYQSLFEALGYMVGTRNLMPPPDSINQELNRHINILAVFAYPDPQKRSEEIGKVMGKINAAQKEMRALTQPPTSTPPTP